MQAQHLELHMESLGQMYWGGGAKKREVCKTINTPHPDKNCLIIPCREDGWEKIDKLHPADRFVPREALQPKQHPPSSNHMASLHLGTQC